MRRNFEQPISTGSSAVATIWPASLATDAEVGEGRTRDQVNEEQECKDGEESEIHGCGGFILVVLSRQSEV